MSKLSPKERISALEAKLQLTLTDHSIALSALTHKSYCNEHRDEPCADNERLEFLGDAVVDLAVSHRLMERFPLASEGELSKLRASIVNEEGLARIARQMGLGELLLLGRGEDLTGGREKSSVLADGLEAVLGAVYMTSGMDKVMPLVDRLFAESFEGVAQGRIGQDYKTLLQEEVQNRLRLSPRYKVISEKGPDHEKIFEIEVSIGADIYARSCGRSKKEAEQAAAKETLIILAAKPLGAPG
ncbi:MAG: ribonuclease III [Myxococcaceae bacterium]|nr:ribonuclease III [Myxococcaceae bacterium]